MVVVTKRKRKTLVLGFFCDAINSCVRRDLKKKKITSNSDDKVVCIIKSCDGATHSVTKHCYITIITQTSSIFMPLSIENHNKNLSTLCHLLSIISTNGKKDINVVGNSFGHYFEK